MKETVKSLARIIAMQRDDAVEPVGPQLLFEQVHFRFVGSVPELAIQILAVPRVARVVLEASRIGDGVRIDAIPRRQVRLIGQIAQETHQRQHAGRFITMDSRENSQTDGITSATRPVENKPR